MGTRIGALSRQRVKDSLKDYGHSLKHTPSLISTRAFQTKTFEQMKQSAELSSVNPMKKTLGYTTLTLLCIGHMIGGGIFILTGVAARTTAGPAVILSYVIGGLIALMTAMNYAEMGADYPLAGASFNYVLAVWGEFPAWITVVAIAIDAMLGAGSLARGWSSYLASLCDQPSDRFLVDSGSYQLDFVAFSIIIVVTAIVAWGTSQTSIINSVVKLTNLFIIVLVLAFTFPHAERKNWDNFFPFGAHGVFQGAALIFFAYGGYNAASNMAEEAKNPQKDVPRAIMTSMGIVTTLYVLMCIAITLAVPYYHIDKGAPFSVLFKSINGWHWASYLVGIGAVIGVGTVLLVGKMTTTRDLLVMARHNLIPPWLAHVNQHTGTPVRIIVLYGLISAIVALLTSFTTLAKLTNVGSLFVVSMIAGVVLWRRYYLPGKSTTKDFLQVFIRLVLLVALSIVFTVAWNLNYRWEYYATLGPAAIAVALSFFLLPQGSFVRKVFHPQHFATFVPAISCSFCIFAAIFLIGSAGYKAIYRFGIVLGVCIGTYIVYGVHAANWHDQEIDEHFNSYPSDEKANKVVEHVEGGTAADVKQPYNQGKPL